MKNLALMIIMSLCFSLSVFAKSGSISINVPLTASSFKIESKKLKGKIKESKGTYSAKKLYVKVKDLSSGMDLRDEHMKNSDRLDEKKFPKIEVTDIKAKGGKGSAVIQIKKKKKKINFKYSTSGDMFVAKFDLNVTEFDLKNLKYLGIGVKDIIHVTANVPIAK